MEKPKRTYSGAGSQKNQGWSEMRRYGEFGPDHLVTVQCVAMVLGIRLQMVKQIPISRRMIDKRVYYRKGDVDAWLAQDLTTSDSLARKLRTQHAESLQRIVKEPSRRYASGQARREKGVLSKSVGPFSWAVASTKSGKSHT